MHRRPQGTLKTLLSLKCTLLLLYQLIITQNQILQFSYTSQSWEKSCGNLSSLSVGPPTHKHHISLPPARLIEVWPKNVIFGLVSWAPNSSMMAVSASKQFGISGYGTDLEVSDERCFLLLLYKQVFFLWCRNMFSFLSHVPSGLQSKKVIFCLLGEEIGHLLLV